MTIDMGDLALLILFVLCLAIFVYLLIKVLKGRAIRIDEVPSMSVLSAQSTSC